MLYIVSGFMRSGTSMMMAALEKGGLDAARSIERDKEMAARWDDPDYVVNSEYYELQRSDYQAPDFPAKFDGKLIKCLMPGAIRLPAGFEYRIVLMRRATPEINTSLFAAFGQANMDTTNPEDFERNMERYTGIMRDRRSVKSLDVLWYRDVLADPVGAFASLDWPIDPVAAARTIDRSKARHAA